MLIPQDFFGDGVGENDDGARSRALQPALGTQSGLRDGQNAPLWDRIVQVHFLAEELLQPDLAPHVTEPMTRFVSAVLKEWAVQAEEALRLSTSGQGAAPIR